MRWFVAPLIAAPFLTGSGFMNALERTTEASARLAETSEEAPERTASAAEGVEDLPRVADLTQQQADAFEILADVEPPPPPGESPAPGPGAPPPGRSC